ncbi:hypothetical protein [Ferrimicrobium acidiphilum]|nr:hypothetical protein [Ferrimicrobium acidiphilum]
MSETDEAVSLLVPLVSGLAVEASVVVDPPLDGGVTADELPRESVL